MNQHYIIYKMSGNTYIFEEIEILVYGSGRHFEFGPKNQISPNGIDGDFFLMLIHTFLKLLTKYQLYIILFGVITHFDCTNTEYMVLGMPSITCRGWSVYFSFDPLIYFLTIS